MSRWGCVGLLSGSLVGLVLVILLVLAIQPITPSITVPPAAVAPDLTLFLSERSISRFASQALSEPTAINFEPGGQVILTTRLKMGWLEPVVDLGLSLEMQGAEVVSQMHWLQLGFLKIPARWLPPEIVEMGTQPGQRITQQLPPQLTLVGLSTTPDGINLQFDWRGQ
jgi:hypothetical protein